MGTAQIAAGARTLSSAVVGEFDLYAFFAVLGNLVIHHGGRAATDDFNLQQLGVQGRPIVQPVHDRIVG